MNSPTVKRLNMQRRVNESNKDGTSMANCNILNPDSMLQTDVLKLDEYCFSGHMTRRAKRSLENAMSNGLVCVPVISCADVAVSLSSSLFTTCCSSSTSVAVTQSSVTSIDLSSSLTTTLTPSSLEGSRITDNNVIKSHSIIAHILTGEDKDLGENAGMDNSEDDKYAESQATLDVDCSDVSSYLEESMHDNSILEKFATSTTDWFKISERQYKEESMAHEATTSSMRMEVEAITAAFRWLEETTAIHIVFITDSRSMLSKVETGMFRVEWLTSLQRSQIDLEADMSDCTKKEMSISPNPDLSSVRDSSSTSCINKWSKCAVFLIAQGDAKSTQLRQDIMQALQIPTIKVVKPCEVLDVCINESCVMIWVQVLIPIQEELLCILSSLRYSIKKATSVYLIAVTDKQSDVDLCLHGFDDVYMEPIPMDAILQKYQKMKFFPLSESSGTESVATMRDTTSTPESTISLESVRTAEYSQSSTCDSVSSGMDLHDISISDLKSTLSVPLCSKSPFLSESTEAEGGRSPLMDPQSPSWCRVEHASKEKQRSLARKLPAHTEKERRERIKDSCDQLRVLLPYVKGRKTDMASILEMTVDYLKIVNAALPQDFQSHVIEIMSNGNPTVEGRLGEIEKSSMTSKKVHRRKIVDLDLSPLGKKQQVEEKASMHTNYDCNIDQSLTNKKVTRSVSRMDATIGVLDKANMNSHSSTIKGCTGQSVNSANVTKRECPLFKASGSSKPKRPHMAIVPTVGEVNSSSVVYLPAGNITPVKETKKDNILGEVRNQSHHFTDNQFPHLFTEGDIPASHMFASTNTTSDMFPYQSHAQMNTPLARVSAADHSDLTTYTGIYFDGAFCHYYPQLQDSNTSSYFGVGGNTEYVNPNAVLPMTSYVPRAAAFTSSQKFDRTSTEFDRYGMGDQKTDVFNNNCNITGFKPSNT